MSKENIALIVGIIMGSLISKFSEKPSTYNIGAWTPVKNLGERVISDSEDNSKRFESVFDSLFINPGYVNLDNNEDIDDFERSELLKRAGVYGGTLQKVMVPSKRDSIIFSDNYGVEDLTLSHMETALRSYKKNPVFNDLMP